MQDRRRELIDELSKVREKVRKRIHEAILTILMYAEQYRSHGSDFSFDFSETLRKGVDEALIALSDGCYKEAEDIVRRLLSLLGLEEDYDEVMEYVENRGENGIVWAFDMHASNLLKTMEQFIAAGFAIGSSTSLIFSNIISYMNVPESSRMWRDGVKAKIIDPNELRFGRGYQRNIVNAVTVLVQDVVNTAYSEALRAEAEEEGSEWYEIFRGSTYDCALCDSYTGIRIPITERILPIHPRCMCYAVFHGAEE